MREQTLVLIKPDGILRGITGNIISRFERVGLKIIGLKMLQAQRETLEKHYEKDDEWKTTAGERRRKELGLPEGTDPIPFGQEIVDGLIEDMQFSPIIAIILEGHNAVKTVKRLTGPTNINDAPPGTIRGDYSYDTFSLSNNLKRPILTIIHATDDPKESQKEIDFWFSPDEIFSYTKPEESIHYRKRE